MSRIDDQTYVPLKWVFSVFAFMLGVGGWGLSRTVFFLAKLDTRLYRIEEKLGIGHEASQPNPDITAMADSQKVPNPKPNFKSVPNQKL